MAGWQGGRKRVLSVQLPGRFSSKYLIAMISKHALNNVKGERVEG